MKKIECQELKAIHQ